MDSSIPGMLRGHEARLKQSPPVAYCEGYCKQLICHRTKQTVHITKKQAEESPLCLFFFIQYKYEIINIANVFAGVH